MYENEIPEAVKYDPYADKRTGPPAPNARISLLRFFVPVALMLAFIIGGAVFLARAQKSRIPPVPLDAQVKILKIQKDQIAQSSRMQLIQQAAQETNAAAQKDAVEMSEAKDAALKSAGLDPTKWDLDDSGETMKFVERKGGGTGAGTGTGTGTPPTPPTKK
jgi:hypothetical protein